MMKQTITVALLIVLLSSFTHTEAQRNVGTTDCLCPVTANIDVVCGSNGATYDNPSALQCASRCLKKDIKIAHTGEC